jgi:uncharacterized membrane protein
MTEEKGRIPAVEYYRILLTTAYILLGILIIYRAVVLHSSPIVYVLGILFAAFGLFRILHVWRYFRGTRTGITI